MTSSVAIALLALALVGAADDAAPARVAIMPFIVEGLAVDEVVAVERAVRTSAAAATQSRILDEAGTRELLRAAGTLGIACDRKKPSCVGELGTLLGVESVVTGVVESSDAGPVATLTVVDVASRMAVRRASATLSSSEDAARVEALVFTLFQDAASRLGALVVDADAGDEIFIDGVSFGPAPKEEPIGGLSVGQHVVEARRDGVVKKGVEVRVGPGQIHQVSLVDDDTISRDVVRSAGRTLLYGGGTVLGVGAVSGLAALVPFVLGWALFVALEAPSRVATPVDVPVVPIYAVYSTLYEWQPLGMITVVAALGLTFVGVGLALGGGSTLLLLGEDDESPLPTLPTSLPTPVLELRTDGAQEP